MGSSPQSTGEKRRGQIVAIIQARMGSRRLPGKVLKDIQGEPMLVRVVERTRRSKRVDQMVVATSTDTGDDPIQTLCDERGYACFRGAEHDVLDRFYQAAKTYNAETIVRITADCPLIDPELIDMTVDVFKEHRVDFAANRLPPPWHRTYPKGLDVEVCSFLALHNAWDNAGERHHREHVMPYLYEEDGRFRTYILQHTPDLGHIRFSVDEPADLELIRTLVSHFGDLNSVRWADIADFLLSRPDLRKINAAVAQNEVQASEERPMPEC